MHRVIFCLLGSIICSGVAAEDRNLKDGIESLDGWGQLVDPDGGCSVQLEGKVLSIHFGPGPRLLDSENSGLMNSPRVVQSIEGDFAIQVVVDGNLPLPDPANVQGRAYISGGLLLMQNGKNYVRLERASFTRSGQVWHYANFEQRVDGQRTRMGLFADFPVPEDKAVEFRIEVKGEDLRALVRQVGDEWHELGRAKVYDRAELLAGVAGVKTDQAEATVSFRNIKTETKFLPVDERSASDLDMDEIRRMVANPQTSKAAWRDLLAEVLEFQQRAKAIASLSAQEQQKLIEQGIEIGTRKTPKQNAYLGPSIARRLAESFTAAKQPEQAAIIYRRFANELGKLRVGSLQKPIEALQTAAKHLEAAAKQ